METVVPDAQGLVGMDPSKMPWRAYDGNVNTSTVCPAPCWISLLLPRNYDIFGLIVYSEHIASFPDTTIAWDSYLRDINNTKISIRRDGSDVKYCGMLTLVSGRTVEQQTYTIDYEAFGHELYFFKDGDNGDIAFIEVTILLAEYAGKNDKAEFPEISKRPECRRLDWDFSVISNVVIKM